MECKVRTCLENYTKEFNFVDFGLLKICSGSAGIIAGLLIPKKGKTSMLTVASLLFSISFFPLMFKLVKTIANSK